MPPSPAHDEEQFMRRALDLARRGQGRVEPNPMVGCVLVQGGRMIAEGYHRRFGGPHAEVEALRRVDGTVRNLTAYVTLEPCSHFGKTPPCADALIRAGVRRVAVAMKDPFPEVAGRGIRRLRRAGIRVDVGLCRAEAALLNTPYLTLLTRQRPYVILKWAQSLDGRIATSTGDSRWISCAAARRIVHRLRARVDAILVGIGTVLADDPQLTARDVPLRRTAARLVLDTRLRLDPKSKLATTARQAPVVVFTSSPALRTRRTRARQLCEQGVTIRTCPLRNGSLSLPAVLQHLAAERLTNLLVEGGGRLLTAFLEAKLVDEVYAFVAPKLIGGASAATPFGGLGARTVSEAITAASARWSRVGPDALCRLRLV